MRNSWLYKLLGAFLLVVAVGGLIISLLTTKATQSAFNLYTTRSGKIWAERLAPSLAGFYSQTNSWQGVDIVIQQNFGWNNTETNSTMMGHGRGQGGDHQFTGGEMMGVLGQRLILADSLGTVVYDSSAEIVGTQLTASQIEEGTPISVGEKEVGTLLITPNNLAELDNAASEFITSVKQAIISSAIIASLLAVLLGTLLFIQITAPMRKLRKAASAIAKGNLNERVNIQGKDEFAELGNTFNKMAENLSLAKTQRQQLMADVAHELRNPLTAIQGTLEAMQDGVLPSDKEQLDAIYSETLLLNRLIGDLRLLSLAETSQLKLELVKVEPSVLIREIVERAQPQAIPKNIDLKANIHENLPGLYLDPDRITQVINNLIANALRYAPQNGTVIVEALQESSSAPFTLTVIDNGQGIDAKDLPHVFNRFYRADRSRSRSTGGSGLGLAIVKELVEAHGGTVSVESPIFTDSKQKGYGTKFIIEFPVKRI